MAAEKLPGAALAITMLETFVPRGVHCPRDNSFQYLTLTRVEILVWGGEKRGYGERGGVSPQLQVLPLRHTTLC